MQRVLFIAMAALMTIGSVALADPAVAMTVTHKTTTREDTIDWTCPGKDPVEHYTETFRVTTFRRDGHRVKEITHTTWRGWVEIRGTDDTIRDAAGWTIITTFSHGHFVRSITAGAVWRFTVPGHGMVVHQTGRSVVVHGGDSKESTYAAFADPSAMCPYV